MTRVEYIQQLEFSLSGRLPQREVSEILRDYSEYFEAGKSEGKSEEEIAVSLGIPSAAAAQILSEIEEQAGERRKKAKPEKKDRGSLLKTGWEKLCAFLRRPLSFLGGFFGDLFEKALEWVKSRPAAAKTPAAGQPGAGGFSAGAQPPVDAYPPPPAATGAAKARRPAASKAPKAPRQRHRFLSFLITLLSLPFIAAALLCGVGLLALAGLGIFALIFFMGALFLAFLAAAVAGSIGFAVAGGLGLPLSFHILFILALVCCLAGSVLTVCGIIYLVKGLVKLIRSCFGSVRWADSARNPAYRAKTANVYENGWDAPTPPPVPGGACENPLSSRSAAGCPFTGGPAGGPEEPPAASAKPSCEEIYSEPIPEPHLQLGIEPEESEEENGHA